MLASLHPNSPTSDQAVKDLLDHRARASHTRYTSVSFSQRSDSPSVYSRGDYSPSALYQPRGEWPSRSGYPVSLAGQDQSNFDDAEEDELTSSMRDSFDHGHDLSPAADDDDDCTSFISAPTPKLALHRVPASPAIRDTESDADSPPTAETEEDPRMSLLGPKMRFVSRAPWELGEDDLLEEDEEEPSSATDTLSMFSGKMSSWRNRDPDKSSVKGLGLSTLRSRSPGPPSASGKKGGNGMNLGLHRHKTHESQREGPYGPYLSGASQSHSAIPSSLASSSRSSHSVTDSLSSDNVPHRLPHGRSRASSPGSRADSFPPLPFPTHPFRPQNASHSSHDDSNASLRSLSPPPSGRFIHPYANPDILPMAGPPPSTPLPRTPGSSQDRLPEERERQGSPLRRASESATSSPRPITTLRKASAGGLPLPALPSRTTLEEYEEEDDDTSYSFANPQSRAPSKPIPSSPVRSMVPYGDQPGSPMHNLITLEQARARAQNAPGHGQSGNSGTTPTPRSAPSSTLVAGLGLAPGVVVDNGVIRGQVQRANAPPLPQSEPGSGPIVPEQRQISNPRPRTMSSGKHMFGSNSGADGDAAPAKTLKHKKSAFMKLFQGGKDKEREKDQLPAPEYPIRSMSTPPQLLPSDSSPVPPLPNTHNIKRIPPPLPLSVVVTSPSLLASGSPPRPGQESSSVRPPSPSRHRQASSPLPSSNHASTQFSNQNQWMSAKSQTLHASESDASRPAASAPPTQTTFETLSLRPVSTIFSAKFPDLLCPSSPPVNPPMSAPFSRRPEFPSPTTPGFSYSRSNSMSTASDYPITPTTGPISGPPTLGLMPGEDQSAVVAALQEQIVNSRKMWQRQIWDLEGQVKDLKAEVEELRNTGECETCGKAKRERRVRTPAPPNVSVVDRPRPRMGGGNTRSVFGGGNDM